MDIAWSKTRKSFPLSEKKILKKTILGSLAISILLIVNFFVIHFYLTANNLENWNGILAVTTYVLIVVLIAGIYKYQQLYFAVYFYDLTPDYVVIRKGPITPHEITIPYERIQDVYVDQDLFDRLFGLFDVHLSSATASSGTEAHIDGVGPSAMDGLRSALLMTVKTRISKAKRPRASRVAK
jgi:membrane protein YdbS with pleckstrin-like domain